MTLLTYSVFLSTRGTADYKPIGNIQLEALPLRGGVIEFDHDGEKVRGIVDAVFIPPGCEENCIGTLFVSEHRTIRR